MVNKTNHSEYINENIDIVVQNDYKSRDGGMVDTKDLKSFGHCGRVGSSPIPGTKMK